jgi:hypothetical protein
VVSLSRKNQSFQEEPFFPILIVFQVFLRPNQDSVYGLYFLYTFYISRPVPVGGKLEEETGFRLEGFQGSSEQGVSVFLQG